ncbi:MAG TPA: DUF6252 family protein [Chitinophagaceae bacterium]|nr:DUF6252 family protein [Chitinophagaceae bacterium]
MNRTIKLFLFAIVILSCNKPSDDDKWSFTWTHQSTSHSATSANAYITQVDLGKGPNHIAASDPALPRDYRISIYLTSLSPGSYTVSLATNKVRYIDDGGYDLAGAAGNVTITSNSNSKLSGNFAMKLINASSDTTLLNGSFANIPLHP